MSENIDKLEDIGIIPVENLQPKGIPEYEDRVIEDGHDDCIYFNEYKYESIEGGRKVNIYKFNIMLKKYVNIMANVKTEMLPKEHKFNLILASNPDNKELQEKTGGFSTKRLNEINQINNMNDIKNVKFKRKSGLPRGRPRKVQITEIEEEE